MMPRNLPLVVSFRPIALPPTAEGRRRWDRLHVRRETTVGGTFVVLMLHWELPVEAVGVSMNRAAGGTTACPALSPDSYTIKSPPPKPSLKFSQARKSRMESRPERSTMTLPTSRCDAGGSSSAVTAPPNSSLWVACAVRPVMRPARLHAMSHRTIRACPGSTCPTGTSSAVVEGSSSTWEARIEN